MKFLGNAKLVLFSLLLIVFFLCTSDGLGFKFRRRFRLGRFRFRLPPKRPPPPKSPPQQLAPNGLPYCPLDNSVKKITEQKRVGRELQEFKRGTSWPYNCLYASILQYQGAFNYLPLIHSCCNSCNLPAFTTCIGKYGGGSWRCPSQGIQCIFECVKKHDPNISITTAAKKLKKLKKLSRGKKLNPKCEKKVRRGGKYCVERLCIPIKL